jgi:hypothetical protein
MPSQAIKEASTCRSIFSPPNNTTSLLFPQSSKHTCSASSLIRRPSQPPIQAHYRASGRRCRCHSGAPPQPQEAEAVRDVECAPLPTTTSWRPHQEQRRMPPSTCSTFCA